MGWLGAGLTALTIHVAEVPPRAGRHRSRSCGHARQPLPGVCDRPAPLGDLPGFPLEWAPRRLFGSELLLSLCTVTACVRAGTVGCGGRTRQRENKAPLGRLRCKVPR